MAEAVTPDKPVEALLNLKESLFICLACEDELINNEALKIVLSSLQNKNQGICVETIPHAKHVMILKEASDYIKQYLNAASHPIISS
jgi:esterase/lipase